MCDIYFRLMQMFHKMLNKGITARFVMVGLCNRGERTSSGTNIHRNLGALVSSLWAQLDPVHCRGNRTLFLSLWLSLSYTHTHTLSPTRSLSFFVLNTHTHTLWTALCEFPDGPTKFVFEVKLTWKISLSQPPHWEHSFNSGKSPDED